MKIGFIGAGRIGRPIIDRLRAAGHEITVLVRRAEVRSDAEADGLSCADTIAATARDADVVFVVVLTDEQVRSVCLGPDGALASMRPGTTLIQHTTSDPVTASLIEAEASDRSISVLDAALSGGPHNIAAGNLTLWIGGETSPAPAERHTGGIAIRSAGLVPSVRLQASMPNGVSLTLEGCDAQLLVVMIDALGHCNVPAR